MRPRPILLLVVAFEAGLATGLARFPAPWVVAGILAGAALVLRETGRGWLTGAVGLGLTFGLAARAELPRWCAAGMTEGVGRAVVRLREPVRDGIALAHPAGVGCRRALRVRVRGRELLPAGARVEVEGRWIPTRDRFGRPAGLLVAREIRVLGREPDADARLRNWIAGTTTRLYGPRAGLVDALVVGRRGGMEAELREAFTRAGLVHLLSISGFHVGVLFGWGVLLLRAVGVRRGGALGGSAALAVAYVAFLGWPGPATRAAALCVLAAFASGRQRKPAAGPLLAVTCLGVTLVDPWALVDLGAWLSAAALAGATVCTRWSDRALGERGWARLFAASVGATLATAPFTAAAFGNVSLAGLALNFVGIPLAAVAVPGVFASLLFAAVFPPLAPALAAGAGLALAGLEATARVGAALPGAAVIGEPGLVAALPWVGVLATAAWILGRNTAPKALLRAGWAAALVALVALMPWHRVGAADEGSGLGLHFLAVGQGDAALLRTPGGHWILVDAGPAGERGDAGRSVIVPYLVRYGVRRLAVFVLSHAHLDHLGGAASVLARIPADLVLDPAAPAGDAPYRRLLDLLEGEGLRWRPARAGDSLVLDGVRMIVVHPDTAWAGWGEDLNDDSLVLVVRWGSFDAVLAGDLGVRAESVLAGRIGRVDLLKVGHHGSAGSSGPAWLAELRPRAAVISVGPNRYGHPSSAALGRLAAAGADVWRTDRDGTLRIRATPSTMTVRSRRGKRTYPLEP